VPRLLLLGFGLDSLSLAKAYQDMHEMLRDPRRKTHCFRAIRMLYELYLREACPCPHRRSPVQKTWRSCPCFVLRQGKSSHCLGS
jgi:hypothetical protein